MDDSQVPYSFGGTDGQYHYNDTWAFDISTRKWAELQCIGFIPSPREGHAAALIDDVIYVFGGRGVDGKDLGDLAAFKISSELSHVSMLIHFPDFMGGRSKVVHVPEHGPFAQWPFGSRDGFDGDESIRPWRRVIHAVQDRRSWHYTCFGY
jgi:hypothetical protein